MGSYCSRFRFLNDVVGGELGKILLFGGAFGILAYQFLADLDKHKYLSKKKNLKMDSPSPDINVFGINMFPFLRKIFNLIPDETRKNLSIKMVSVCKNIMKEKY